MREVVTSIVYRMVVVGWGVMTSIVCKRIFKRIFK